MEIVPVKVEFLEYSRTLLAPPLSPVDPDSNQRPGKKDSSQSSLPLKRLRKACRLMTYNEDKKKARYLIINSKEKEDSRVRNNERSGLDGQLAFHFTFFQCLLSLRKS